jgi:hypothetical protein
MATTPEPTPRISLSNNQLGMLLALVTVLTQAKDAVSAWAVSRERQSAINKQVETLESELRQLRAIALEHTQLINKNDSGLKAEISRSYEADQGFQRMLDQLRRPEPAKSAGDIPTK